MNLILFTSDELDRPLPVTDRRARHILEVLRRKIGDTFDVGRVDGPRGKATLRGLDATALDLVFSWGPAPSPPAPLTLIVGLPRPQTARDILRDATTLGVASIHFVRTDRSEASYAQSSLWTSGEWQRHVFAGAEQAFDPQVPRVTWSARLDEQLAGLDPATARFAFDNYEASAAFGSLVLPPAPGYAVALGAERGWSGPERDTLRAHRFTLVHLGPRVLRAETAVVAALALLRAKLGLL